MTDQAIFTHYLRWLFALLFFKAGVMMCVILFAGIGLAPDEAQYWTWSHALDWGYYSKPPAIAWQIWLGTQLFGDTELGVRFMAIIISILQTLAIYFLALRSGLKTKTAFWAACFMAFSPLGILGSLLATTDGGFILFWTCAAACMTGALRESQPPNPLTVGLCVLGGALYKWPAFAFWIFYLMSRHFYFPQQKMRQVLQGVTVSLIALLPSIWWNYTHDWATFRHVFSTVQGGHGKAGGNFFEFISAQAALLSPLLFILFILSFYGWRKERKTLSPTLHFCAWVSLGYLGIGMLLSLFQKIQGNWVAAAYPTAFVVMGWWLIEKKQEEAWAKGGVILSIAMSAALVLIPSVSSKVFKHQVGWERLNQALMAQGYDPTKEFLFSDKYQTTSLLSFYSPGQKRAYFFNLGGARKNQFSYWPNLKSDEKGKSGYFVWIENTPHWEKEFENKKNHYQSELKHYFEKVEFAGSSLLLDNGKKGALFFKCQNCIAQPVEKDLY